MGENKKDEEIGQKAIQQIFDVWIGPYLKELKSLGKIDDDFKLMKAQLVFSADKSKPIIRLNSQVKGKILAVAKKGLKRGEIITADQVLEIKGYIRREEKKNKNKAIMTLILIKDKWFLDFDMRYNKDNCKETIEAANEFYYVAESAKKRGNIRPIFENCFAAAELATKAILGTLPHKMIKEKTHEATLKALEEWSRLGNIDQKYVDCLKKLNKIRPSARYMASKDHKKIDPELVLKLVKEMIEIASRGVSPSASLSS